MDTLNTVLVSYKFEREVKRMKIKKAIVFASIGALLLALLPLPYAYYMLLRIGICGVFAYFAFLSFQSKQEGLTWVLGITAAVYNPFVPLHLGRDVWSIINLSTIGLLFYLRSKVSDSASSEKE